MPATQSPFELNQQRRNETGSLAAKKGCAQLLLLPPAAGSPSQSPLVLICCTLAMGSFKVDRAGKEGGQSQELGRAKQALLLPPSFPGSLNSLPRGGGGGGGGDPALGCSHGSRSEEEGTGQRGTKPPPTSPTCITKGPRKQSRMLSNKAPLLD